MAPVIWGLDLSEIKWSKFKSSNMWSRDYHLRRTRFIVYQLAMILLVCSESVGTDCLSNYLDSQKFVHRLNKQAVEYNDDFIGIASYNIFTGVYVATIFGAAFFFDLFWPTRHESKGVRLAWKICAVLACLFSTACVIALTIIVTTKSAYVTGVRKEEANRLLRLFAGYPLIYHKNARALAALILHWLGYPFVIASTIIMWISKNHDDKFGPYSTHVREADKTKEIAMTEEQSSDPAAQETTAAAAAAATDQEKA